MQTHVIEPIERHTLVVSLGDQFKNPNTGQVSWKEIFRQRPDMTGVLKGRAKKQGGIPGLSQMYLYAQKLGVKADPAKLAKFDEQLKSGAQFQIKEGSAGNKIIPAAHPLLAEARRKKKREWYRLHKLKNGTRDTPFSEGEFVKEWEALEQRAKEPELKPANMQISICPRCHCRFGVMIIEG